jgi:hypothetical protein
VTSKNCSGLPNQVVNDKGRYHPLALLRDKRDYHEFLTGTLQDSRILGSKASGSSPVHATLTARCHSVCGTTLGKGSQVARVKNKGRTLESLIGEFTLPGIEKWDGSCGGFGRRSEAQSWEVVQYLRMLFTRPYNAHPSLLPLSASRGTGHREAQPTINPSGR